MASFNKIYNIVISAVCMGLAQYPLGLSWLSWFCLVPLFIAIKNENKFKGILSSIFIWGFIYHLISVFWLTDNIGVPRYVAFITMLLVNIVSTFYIVITFSIWHTINRLNKRKIWYSLPFIWTMVDYFSSLLSVSFPGTSIAATQANSLLLILIQFVELTGMFGITFWIVSINISLFYIYINRSKVRILESISIFLTPLIIGLILKNIELENLEEIDFAILQPNIHIDDKSNNFGNRMIDDLIAKSNDYIEKDPFKQRLLIWPETAFNHYYGFSNDRIYQRFKGTNIQLLSGVYEIKNKDVYYNSVYYLNEQNNYSLKNISKDNIYRKMILVPGAEYVPFSSVFPFLNNIALSGNFSYGNEYTLFEYRKDSSHKLGVNFGVMVCIESTFPSLSRKFVNRGAQFLVYVANDGWYLNPPQARQHAKHTIFRAIENRKPVLRCGNTGITWVLNAYGEIVKELNHNDDNILTSDGIEVYSNTNKTLYVLAGDWLAYLSLLVTFYFIAYGFIRKTEKK
jgi:apolipoprotein N-acyltransferase